MSRWLCASLALVLLLPRAVCAEDPVSEAPVQLDTPVANFTLRDFHGKAFALDDYASQPVVVLVFLGVDCPLARIYALRLEKVAVDYKSRGVTLLGIDSNAQDSITELAAYARNHNIKFPLLKDPGGTVAAQLKATRTPEVFILDRDRFVRYHGRIDDQYAVGSTRPEPTRHDLRRALDELLAGKAVSQPTTELTGCLIGKSRRPDETAAVTYNNKIAALLERRCVDCHRPGQIAPFSLTDYDEVAGWADMIGEVVAAERMPPWHANPRVGQFVGDRRLSDQEKDLIKTWVAAGAPRGKAKDQTIAGVAPVSSGEPAETKHASEAAERLAAGKPSWSLPQAPDVVIPMRTAPFKVQAQGIVEYKYFKVDPGFKEDRWISAAELLPGNRAVVHHALVHALATDLRDAVNDGTTEGFLAAYVPGMRPASYPKGMAKRIAAGSHLLFQIHYVANGSEQFDCTQLGLVFVDSAQVQKEVVTSSVRAMTLVIPPRAARYSITADSIAAPVECQLLSMMPHMHLRGSAFNYELVPPDGNAEQLLDVPHYDSHWQTAYRLAKPRTLPAGSKLRCTANFDNSTDNLNNPDASKEVYWGPLSTDEMMVGYFDIAVPKRPEEPRRRGKAAPRKPPAVKTPGAKTPVAK
jgi:peroxiredoxin